MRMSADLALELVENRGFAWDGKGFYWGTGSIVNYSKVTVSDIVTENIYDDVTVDFVRVNYERLSDPGSCLGYRHDLEDRWVPVEDLLAWLDQKGIKDRRVLEKERQERFERLRRRAKEARG